METINCSMDLPDGNKVTFRLLEKLNNENGQTIYTFRNEVTMDNIILCKKGNEWKHLQGKLPSADCISVLVNHIDSLNEH